jgi:hypothetical protein
MPVIRENVDKDINDNISNINMVNLPWYVPGPPMDKVKIENIKPKLKSWDWDWEDLRDFLCLIGLQSQDLETPIPQVGEKIEDYKKIVMMMAKSLWNIQTYAHNKTYDPIAMEARVIAEAVCSYFLKERLQVLGESLKLIEEINPILNRLLRRLRKAGCVSVHLNTTLTKNKNIFRIDEDIAYSIICTVFDVLDIVRNDIRNKYVEDSNIANTNLYKNRIRLSANRLCLETVNEDKKKSCADESKEGGCCRIGCPFLHRCNKNFDEKDSKKNLEIIQIMKQKKNKK